MTGKKELLSLFDVPLHHLLLTQMMLVMMRDIEKRERSQDHPLSYLLVEEEQVNLNFINPLITFQGCLVNNNRMPFDQGIIFEENGIFWSASFGTQRANRFVFKQTG